MALQVHTTAVAVTLVVCAAMALVCVCVVGVLTRPAHTSLLTHACVAATLLPLAVLLMLMLTSMAEMLPEWLSRLSTLPRPLAVVAAAMQPPQANMSLLDMQAMACLLLVAYGSVVLWRRGVDILRLLKVSHGRLVHMDTTRTA